MKIGIIGAGWVGRTLAEQFLKLGHEVMISNSRDPETLLSTQYGLGCQAGYAHEAAAFGEIVIVAIPMSALGSLPRDALAGKLIVDTNNYYPQRDGKIPALEDGTATASALLAQALPGARITKAFNAIRMLDVGPDARPEGAADRRALPLCGDHDDDKAVIAGLYNAMGYDTVDAGALSEGWRFERDMPVYCIPLSAAKLTTMLAEAKWEDRLQTA